MGRVGVTGFGYLTGSRPALKMVGQTSMRIVTDYTFGVIPMFLPMGGFGGSRATTSCKRCCKPPARRRRCSRCRSGRSCSVTS